MKIGIGLPNPVRGADGRLMIDWARRADERGFSTLATIDRIAFPTHDSLIVLAAAAGVTERITLLTNILLAPTRDAALLAKEAATLDRISGGRFILGLGVGGREDDFGVTGRDFSGRGANMDALLDQLRRAWRGETLEGTDQLVSPPPTRESGVPILMGGGTEAAMRRTAEYAIGWTAGGSPPDALAPALERVRAAWESAGREGRPKTVALAYWGLGPRAEAGGTAEYIGDYYAFLGPWAAQMASSIPVTPEGLSGMVAAFEATGVDELILDPTVPELDQVDRLADLLGERLAAQREGVALPV